MFKDNEWYSHRKILTNYCGFKDKPIYGTIQHGWFRIEDQDISKLQITKFPLCSFFCWNEEIKRKFNKKGIKNVIPIGAPFIYLADHINDDQLSNIQSNVIIFPPHSDYETNQPSGFDSVDELINRVHKSFSGPFTVCLYYQDLKKDFVNKYKSAGWNVVSCGNKYSVDFLRNFIDLVKKHKKVVVCEFTTAGLYSIYLKKETIFLKLNKIHRNYYGEVIKDHDYDIFKDLKILVDENIQFKKKMNL